MERSISATEARVHFGQWLRQVKDKGVTLIVEKAGRPEAVLLSLHAYQRLCAAGAADAGTDALERARASRERIQARRKGEPLPPPEDVIDRMREERDGELPGLR